LEVVHAVRLPSLVGPDVNRAPVPGHVDVASHRDNTIFCARPVIAPVPPPPELPGASSITSSNWTTALPRNPGTTAPDSGVVRRIAAGVVRGGPPGGSPWFAQPNARALRSSPAT